MIHRVVLLPFRATFPEKVCPLGKRQILGAMLRSRQFRGAGQEAGNLDGTGYRPKAGPGNLENGRSGSGIRPLTRGPPGGGLKRRWRMRQDHLCGRPYQRRPRKVQSGAHPSTKQPVAGCFALRLVLNQPDPRQQSDNDTPVQPQPRVIPGSSNGGSSERSSEG